MTIKQLVEICHEIAVKKGWWDNPRNDGELIALMHSELSETLEELRIPECNMYKVGEELADCIIRIFDYVGARNIDLETILKTKIEKNKLRPYKHGKEF